MEDMDFVQLATRQDLPELMELREAYLTADFGELSREQSDLIMPEVSAYLWDHLGKDIHAFVLRREGRIASCVWLLTVMKPPSPRFPHGRTGILFNVYTRPEYRRRGLAKRVMQAVVDGARELNLDVIELNATDEGYPLYRSIGFADDSSTHVAMRMML